MFIVPDMCWGILNLLLMICPKFQREDIDDLLARRYLQFKLAGAWVAGGYYLRAD